LTSGDGTYNQGQSCTVTATAITGYTFVCWMEGSDVVSTEANYTFTVNSNRTLVANFSENGGGGGGSHNGHDYVDLGLPSGTLWATCNVGADTPEGYGNYFAWGETQPKNYYEWSTYNYSYGSHTTITKYCYNSNYGYNGFTDNLTTLESSDDAATANWGTGWRMPTEADWRELMNNTTCTWTTQNGVNGRLFTAANGNSIFIPAAGCRYGNGLNYAGSRGYYRTSSLDMNYPDDAESFGFNPSTYYMGDYNVFCYGNRCQGFSVRPVCSAK
jgi:hypothetical protein